jgi:hypothetical protein
MLRYALVTLIGFYAFSKSNDSMSRANEHARDDSPLQKAVDRLLQYSSAKDVAKAYARFFPRLDLSELRSLSNHPNSGIALRAAWEEVRRSVALHELNGMFPVYRPDPQVLFRFHSFLENRLGVSTPEWWKETLFEAESTERWPMRFRARQTPPYHDTRLPAFGVNNTWQAPKDTRLVKRDEVIEIKVGDKQATVSSRVFDERKKQCNCVSLAIEMECSYLALHDRSGGSFPLLCFDTNQKQLWESKVWAMDGLLAHGGGGYFLWVAVVVKGDSVLVFGVDNYSVSLEGFNRKDGANTFRFCSYY